MKFVFNIKSAKENGKTKSYLPPKARSELKHSSSNRRKLIAQALNAVENGIDKEKRRTSWSHLTPGSSIEFPPRRSGPSSSQTKDSWGNLEYDLFEADTGFKGVDSVQSSRTSLIEGVDSVQSSRTSLIEGSGKCSRRKKPSKRGTKKESSGKKRS
jgi:hypothetical protein